MTAYIDYDFYTNTFKGVPLSDDTFNSLVDRASDMIDIATNYRIEKIGFENFHARIQLLIKKATASQLENLSLNGGIATLQSSGVSNASVGRFSYTVDGSSSEKGKSICDFSKSYLKATGLLYGGVRVC